MILDIFQIIFLLTTFFAAIGLAVIIYSRNRENITSRLFILMLVLVNGYIISHSIHFLFMRTADVTILDMSCHSFLLVILVTLTFFTWNYPTQKKMGMFRSMLILVPSVGLLTWLWSGALVQESHSHIGKFEAHYGDYYPIFLLWYTILLGINIFWLVEKYKSEKNPDVKRRSLLFIMGLLLTNFVSFIFGLLLPWILGFYFLVEISPLAFLIGVILFTTVAVGKYDMFPAALNRVKNFSINRKVILSALVLVPIIILMIQIPVMDLIFEFKTNTDLINHFIISLFGGLIVSISISFVILKVISNPINKLKSKAVEIEKGNYGIKLDYKSNDEIGELTEAFNTMSETLNNNSFEIQEKESRILLLLNAFEKSSAAIAIVDPDFKIVEVNSAFCSIIGKERNNIIGNDIKVLQFSDQLTKENKKLLDEIIRNKKFEGELVWYDQDNSKRYMFLSVTPTSLDINEHDGFLFVEVDITKNKILEEQLLKAEKLSALGEMAAILAHEIKTPLTSIKMNADILNESLALQQDDEKSFSIIQKEINRLNNLVKDVLLFSKQTDLVYSELDLHELIENIKIQLENSIKQKNANFINNVNSLKIEGDHEKLKQVFLNLIDNSIDVIKDEGTIEISSNVEEDKNRVFIFIRDTGGSNMDKENIFEPFYTTKASGTGLGLSISQKIIKLHNGNITLEISNVSETVFKIEIPVRNKV